MLRTMLSLTEIARLTEDGLRAQWKEVEKAGFRDGSATFLPAHTTCQVFEPGEVAQAR